MEKIEILIQILSGILEAEDSPRILDKLCEVVQDTKDKDDFGSRFCKGVDCFECPFWVGRSVREAQKTQINKLKLILNMVE